MEEQKNTYRTIKNGVAPIFAVFDPPFSCQLSWTLKIASKFLSCKPPSPKMKTSLMDDPLEPRVILILLQIATKLSMTKSENIMKY